ncbi:MAG: hypothetical protein HY897_21715 [Deltaproteobacteria bacterium]|nr:hypothetical protein [Deltaproteobacteria bacterium]
MRNPGAWVVVCLAALAAMPDCGGNQACNPGDTQECECATGAKGTRTCFEDGSDWGMCRCSDADGGDGGNPCDALSGKCAECPDPQVQEACHNAIASLEDGGEEKACLDWIDAWDSYKDSICGGGADGGGGRDGGGDGCEFAGDYCPGGRCFNRAGTEDLFCAAECYTVGDACEAGGCYYTVEGSYCFEAGYREVGEACNAASDCVVGATCLDNGGMSCWLVCVADEDCDAPAVCTDTSLGFSVCFAEE